MISRPGWAHGGEFWQLELSAPQLRAEAPLRIALAAGGDRQVRKDRQAGPLLHILWQWRDRGREACADGMSRDFTLSGGAFLACLIWQCRRACVRFGDGTE